MKKNLITILNVALSCFIFMNATAQVKWTCDVLAGDVYCFKTPLTIKQSGHPDIEIYANYATNSFILPIYYSVKIGKWHNERAWELEFIHLKIKLKNNAPEVQRFEVSHGFNLLLLNRSWIYQHFVCRLGGGIVIAHPENTIRGEKLAENRGILNEGYYIAGSTLQFGVSKKLALYQNLYLKLEGKFIGSYARVPVVHGKANVSNLAVHGLVGVEYEF